MSIANVIVVALLLIVLAIIAVGLVSGALAVWLSTLS
jgi:hypothetical protein